MAVYFAEAKMMGRVRIGCTSGDPYKRLANLQTGSPDTLQICFILPGGSSRQESRLHKQFAKHRLHGEWFVYSEEIKRFVQERLARRRQWQEYEREEAEEAAYQAHLDAEEAAYEAKCDSQYEDYVEAQCLREL